MAAPRPSSVLCLLAVRVNMASWRCARVLLAKSVFPLQNVHVPHRTLCSVVHRQCSHPLLANNRSKWVGLYQYSTEKIEPEKAKASTIGLADELLAAKVQPDPKDKGSEEAGQESEKEKHEKAKRTLKLTFISFGVMITGMGGVLLWAWGEDTFPLLLFVYFCKCFCELY